MTESERSHIITTRPVVPPRAKLPTLRTINPCVFLRPFQANDLASFHELRTQIEVMQWTSTGKIDSGLDKTREWMSRFFDFEDNVEHCANKDVLKELENASIHSKGFNFAIVYVADVLENADATVWPSGEVIGAAGCHVLDPEPEIGYMIRKEYWGRGITTAVVQTILDVYWSFERKTVRLSVSPQDRLPEQALREANTGEKPFGPFQFHVREVLKASIVATNIGSQRVLEKCGFQHQRSETVAASGEEIVMAYYDLARP